MPIASQHRSLAAVLRQCPLTSQTASSNGGFVDGNERCSSNRPGPPASVGPRAAGWRHVSGGRARRQAQQRSRDMAQVRPQKQQSNSSIPILNGRLRPGSVDAAKAREN